MEFTPGEQAGNLRGVRFPVFKFLRLCSLRRAFGTLRYPLLICGCFCWAQACSTSRPLPTYEPPLPRADRQIVRTTAYTHTESDHVEYGNHNALGGTLQAAGPPVVVAAPSPAPSLAPPRALPVGAGAAGSSDGGFRRTANSEVFTPPPAVPSNAPVVPPQETIYGSAAADWSRWPVGTIFRIISTGQLYRVDDYGWALSGRNTIDLYMPTRAAMNAWSVRREAIEILRWGDREESLRILRPRARFRHIHRMVLELEGNARAAARLE